MPSEQRCENGLFIFTRDLRIIDNNGLNEAVNNCNKVYTVFFFNKEQVVNNPFKSENAVQFMIESLEDLSKAISSKGGKLIVLFDYEKSLRQCIEKLDIDAVYINKDVTPYAKLRDDKMEKIAKRADASFHQVDDFYLVPPGTIETSGGKPYVKFTPYYDRVMSEVKAKRVSFDKPSTSRSINSRLASGNIRGELKLSDALKRFGGKGSPSRLVNGGRDNALKQMKVAKQNVKNYEATRNDLSDKTTQLSAYIKFGNISIREMNEFIKTISSPKARESLQRQLVWRDFYAQILYHNPEVLSGAMKESLDDIKWVKNKQFADAWKEGKTGYPIIDAAMRQLKETGYMHNRARLIAGSFLPKTLLLDWQIGEKHFARMLTDYDPASNNGNWQWVAGTGSDSQPYFRILNPSLQSKKYDTDAEYIKRWVPELESVPAKDIHNWAETHVKYKDVKYPSPIVDYSDQKEKALDMYSKALRS